MKIFRVYGTAFGDLHISDLVNNPTVNCEVGVFGLSFPKQLVDVFSLDLGALLNDASDPTLITEK